MSALILSVEDEPDQQRLLSAVLANTRHRVEFASTVAEAIVALARLDPDVVLLDIGLPDGSGLDVLREVRKSSHAYVIVVSARTDELDRVVGLAAGADDYICKPYSLRELEMRIEAVLRRPRSQPTASSGENGGLVVDNSRREASVAGHALDLTRREFDLLATLVDHAGLVLSRRQLLDHIWGVDWFDERVVISHMSNLRAKLGEHGADDLLVTVRGVGYRLDSSRA